MIKKTDRTKTVATRGHEIEARHSECFVTILKNILLGSLLGTICFLHCKNPENLCINLIHGPEIIPPALFPIGQLSQKTSTVIYMTSTGISITNFTDFKP